MIHVLFKFVPNPYGGVGIDTTSNGGIYRELSPFILGPINIPELFIYCQNFENLWQFSKVYSWQVVPATGKPDTDWYKWRAEGFRDTKAHRYPIGKDRKPLYSWWREERLSYIEARKQIYAPIYAEFVQKTNGFKRLQSLHESLYDEGKQLILRDYDAYDHVKLGISLKDVINNPNKKCGHAFILAMILEGVLEECIK